MRRSAVSITSNIAEGFSRRTFKDKANFYTIANGSLTELLSQLLVSRDIGYISKEQFHELQSQLSDAQKQINGLIKKTRQIARSPNS
jgi:four helix bundle protein